MWLAKCSPTSSNKLLIDNHQRVAATVSVEGPPQPYQIATTPDSASSNRSTLSRRYQLQCRRPDYVHQSIVATTNNHPNHHLHQHNHLHHYQTTLCRSAIINTTTKLSVAMEIHIQQQCVSAQRFTVEGTEPPWFQGPLKAAFLGATGVGKTSILQVGCFIVSLCMWQQWLLSLLHCDCSNPLELSRSGSTKCVKLTNAFEMFQIRKHWKYICPYINIDIYRTMYLSMTEHLLRAYRK